MTPTEMKKRTKAFALGIVGLSGQVPNTTAGRVLIQQIVRSGTSVGANYRASCRARSKAEFVSKLAIAEEEADETAYWLELLAESALVPRDVVRPLWKEADELTRILHSSRKTAKEVN